MFLQVEQLKELVKSYTIAQTVADSTGASSDQVNAQTLLDQINQLRLNLALQAEVLEVFWEQQTIPLAATVNTSQNSWFSKNDRSWLLRRGVAALDAGATVSLQNQGERQRVITREAVAWQQLFASVQSIARGQETLFDLPETLRFGKNQSLNIAVQGEATGDGSPAQGYIFLHGATIKENLVNSIADSIKAEFLNQDGTTKYLPETQLVPLQFQFASATVGTLATDPNGSQDIFTVKGDRSVLLLGVSNTAPNCRIDKLTDEGRNQTLAERIEMAGVASNYLNAYETYYDLPFPHLLRAGDRLKGSFLQGSQLSNTTTGLNTIEYMTFWGLTV